MCDHNEQSMAEPMATALAQAKRAFACGEVPVGAVIVHLPTGKIIAKAHNLTETNQDATAHAELLAIHQAQTHLGTKSLQDCALWVTLEPCAMCAGAIAHSRIARLYFGASDPKGGAVEHGPHLFNQATTHHKPEIYGGFSDAESRDLLQSFFAKRRG